MTTKSKNGGPPDQDLLIVVDEKDKVQGFSLKSDCHRQPGILHRAFSIFLFNSSGNLLLQQRSANKPLWPLFWSNSCCSHPRKGETLLKAAKRRQNEELGMNAPLKYLFTFSYQAHFKNIGSEHEMCAVFIGQSDQIPRPNKEEIAAINFLSPNQVTSELRLHPNDYTPWFHIEWEEILKHDSVFTSPS